MLHGALNKEKFSESFHVNKEAQANTKANAFTYTYTNVCLTQPKNEKSFCAGEKLLCMYNTNVRLRFV